MVDAMTSEVDAVAITAIEFWSVVCDVEIELEDQRNRGVC